MSRADEGDIEDVTKRNDSLINIFISLSHKALHLFPTVNAVAEHNLEMLHNNGQPVAEIKDVHRGPRAHTATSEDAGGLEPVVHVGCGARVMLTSNLWVDAGLVNGAMGTVKAIHYQSGGPPDFPVAVMVSFDLYFGPTTSDGSVPIRCSWMSGGSDCSRLQLASVETSLGNNHSQSTRSNFEQGYD